MPQSNLEQFRIRITLFAYALTARNITQIGSLNPHNFTKNDHR